MRFRLIGRQLRHVEIRVDRSKTGVIDFFILPTKYEKLTKIFTKKQHPKVRRLKEVSWSWLGFKVIRRTYQKHKR